MLSFTDAQLQAWLGQFIWPFVRMLALIGSAPVFSESTVPILTKVGLAAVLTVMIAPAIGPVPAIPPGSLAGLWMIGQQFFIGIAMGLTMRLIFVAVQTAGEFIGLQMGLSFASFFDPSNGTNTAVLSRIFNIIAMLTFLTLDGHLLILGALLHSFEALPISQTPLDPKGWGNLLDWSRVIFVSGLLLALPLIVSLLTINLAMGILNRAAPQLSVFSIGFPVMLIVGLLILTTVMPNSAPFLESLFESGLRAMDSVVNGMAGN